MGLSYVAAISCGLVLVTGILAQIGTALGDIENIVWIPGGWSVASAVSFSIAGGFSDIFGRRYVLICGQAITLIGAVSVWYCSNHLDKWALTATNIFFVADCWRYCTEDDYRRCWIYYHWVWCRCNFCVVPGHYRVTSE